MSLTRKEIDARFYEKLKKDPIRYKEYNKKKNDWQKNKNNAEILKELNRNQNV
jgi:hypothetical protein